VRITRGAINQQSTLFTTQLPLDHWSEVIGDASSPMPSATALSTRRRHHITGESYRASRQENLPAGRRMAKNRRLRLRR